MIPHNIKNKLYLLFLSLPLLLFLQCGLNTYPYLYPPDTVARLSGSDGIFVIANRSDNDDAFLGYDLYYKFYNFTDANVTMASDDRAIFSVEQPTPTDVTRLGFRRVNTIPDTDKPPTRSPMIPVYPGDRNSSFNIRLDFTGVSSLSAETAIPPIIPEVNYLSNQTVYLYRQVLDPDDDSPIKNKYKSFGDLRNELSGQRDADLPQGRATLSLYIFAYGKYNKVYNIYSKPLWLGYIDYTER